MSISASRTSYYLDIVTGRRRGLGASLVRAALTVPAYALWLPASTAARAWKLYGPAKTYRAPCPVISVGNLTAGGTGKTPMVEWLALRLKADSRRPAILSRGYRATSGTNNDESQLLAEHLAGVPILTGKDRAASARQAIQQSLANVFILDDGFQHYAMQRDLDIVLIDCLLPFGGGHLLPRGLLREPLSALHRADAIVLTRSDLVSEGTRRQIKQRLAAIDPSLPIAEAVHAPVDFIDNATGEHRPLDIFRASNVLLFSGVGNPEGFERSVETLGARAAAAFRFRDHHRYYDHELIELAQQAEKHGCAAVLTTEKDLVKIGRCWKAAIPLLALRVRLQITSGEAMLLGLIESALVGGIL